MTYSVVVLVLLLESALSAAGSHLSDDAGSCNRSEPCPVWSVRTQDGCCQCDSQKYLYGKAVMCKMDADGSSQISLENCYCPYYDEVAEETLVAPCPHTCYHKIGIFHYVINRTSNYAEFNRQICSGEVLGLNLYRNASSRLCGKCVKEYGIPVYSFQYSRCVRCHHHYYLAFYFLAALVPLTIFYFIILIFRVSATSGTLNSFIFFSQVVTSPVYMRLFINAIQAYRYPHNETLLRILYALYGVWNLDFFRTLYNPFCFNHGFSAQSVISMDYLVALYPLILVLCTYRLAVLYERGCRPIVFIWKPFYKCFARFQRQWNIKNTLLQTFSTFMLLSYVKILGVSYALLIPTITIRSPHVGKRSTFYYYDATVTMFDLEHIGFFVSALGILLLCVFLPLILLLIYPCKCFHRVVKIKRPEFHIFMDTFLGCYRQPSYCRAFAGIYFLIRILFLAIFEVFLSLVFIPTLSAMSMFVAILFAIARPYRKSLHNIMDVLFFVYLGIYFNIQNEVLLTQYLAAKRDFFVSFFVILLSLPLFYPTYLSLRTLYCSSAMQSVRDWCFKSGREELLDTVLSRGEGYGSLGASVTLEGPTADVTPEQSSQ